MIESHFHTLSSISSYKNPKKKIKHSRFLEDSLRSWALFSAQGTLSQAEPAELKATAAHKVHHQICIRCRSWWQFSSASPCLSFSCALIFCLHTSLSLANHQLVIKLLARAHYCVSLSSLPIAKLSLRLPTVEGQCIDVPGSGGHLWEIIWGTDENLLPLNLFFPSSGIMPKCSSLAIYFF